MIKFNSVVNEFRLDGLKHSRTWAIELEGDCQAKASGWTAKVIAARRDISLIRQSLLLTFGWFLGFVPVGTSPGKLTEIGDRFSGLSPIGDKFGKLTEGAFRERWSETKRLERPIGFWVREP